MNYYIKRDQNEYGPYALADLQRYVAQGNIVMTDLARSEGLADWVPVVQVLGNIPVPLQATPGAMYGAAPGFGAVAAPVLASSLAPPDFHWVLVLLLSPVTCFLFFIAWLIVEAAWIRKIKPQSKGLLLVLLSVGGFFVGGFINTVAKSLNNNDPSLVGTLIELAALVLYFAAIFTMRGDLEDYYNTTENIGLTLSPVVTFLFAVFYFQYHFSRIAAWKKTGVIQPQ
jgi:hypothetical protein